MIIELDRDSEDATPLNDEDDGTIPLGSAESANHASAAAPTWCIVMAAATAGEMRGECCANVSSAGVASQVVLHCSVLRTLVRRIEARTLHSSHVRTCLSLSGIDLAHCRTQRADGKMSTRIVALPLSSKQAR